MCVGVRFSNPGRVLTISVQGYILEYSLVCSVSPPLTRAKSVGGQADPVAVEGCTQGRPREVRFHRSLVSSKPSHHPRTREADAYQPLAADDTRVLDDDVCPAPSSLSALIISSSLNPRRGARTLISRTQSRTWS